jgi:hypothetical protein
MARAAGGGRDRGLGPRPKLHKQPRRCGDTRTPVRALGGARGTVGTGGPDAPLQPRRRSARPGRTLRTLEIPARESASAATRAARGRTATWSPGVLWGARWLSRATGRPCSTLWGHRKQSEGAWAGPASPNRRPPRPPGGEGACVPAVDPPEPGLELCASAYEGLGG